MSSDSSSFALPSETDVLEVSPFTGLTACTASTAPQRSPATRSRVAQNGPHNTPLVKSISAVLLDIDTPPSPSSSSDLVTTEPLEYACPLTERALRYQRRDPLRATHDVAALTPPPGTVRSNTILQKKFPSKFLNYTVQTSVSSPNGVLLFRANYTNIVSLQPHLE